MLNFWVVMSPFALPMVCNPAQDNPFSRQCFNSIFQECWENTIFSRILEGTKILNRPSELVRVLNLRLECNYMYLLCQSMIFLNKTDVFYCVIKDNFWDLDSIAQNYELAWNRRPGLAKKSNSLWFIHF
jgi:hypothetical protein